MKILKEIFSLDVRIPNRCKYVYIHACVDEQYCILQCISRHPSHRIKKEEKGRKKKSENEKEEKKRGNKKMMASIYSTLPQGRNKQRHSRNIYDIYILLVSSLYIRAMISGGVLRENQNESASARARGQILRL